MNEEDERKRCWVAIDKKSGEIVMSSKSLVTLHLALEGKEVIFGRMNPDSYINPKKKSVS